MDATDGTRIAEALYRTLYRTPDPIVEAVIEKYGADWPEEVRLEVRRRSDAGIRKFGVTMAANHEKTIEQWLKDAKEELCDSLVYLEKANSMGVTGTEYRLKVIAETVGLIQDILTTRKSNGTP